VNGRVFINGVDVTSAYNNDSDEEEANVEVPNEYSSVRTIHHPNGTSTTISTIRSNNGVVRREVRSTSNNNISSHISINSTGTNNNNNNNNMNISSNSHINTGLFPMMFHGNAHGYVNPFLISQNTSFDNILQQYVQMIGMPRTNPVETEILDLLPEITIEDVSKIPNEKRDCVVCLTKYESNEKAIILPCTHMFHTDCIKSWFKDQNTCPICKIKIDARSMGISSNENDNEEDI
jgi:hypothetical protein